MVSTNFGDEYCPDCGRLLQTVWDYPANELWCVHCGNRYFTSLTSEDSPGAFDGHRILLLDELGDRRAELARQLTRVGYQVTPVCHARQALEAASFRRFDVMVLSATMSEFHCDRLISKMRQLMGGVKFVVINPRSSVLDEFHDSGIRCTIIDDVNFQDLVRALEPLLEELTAERDRQPAGTSHYESLAGVS